ncbi:borealin-like isoform X2 [Drosophila serrata]|uniref:borealin-like isoform X2 n=1 Tax=Drosophila serrata TaxID=7274 RepID=UPI000A1D1F0F|nr:borealin-like isoform X2 [Drosophila serrata]
MLVTAWFKDFPKIEGKMPRLRDNAAKKAQRKDAVREEKVRLAQIKMDSTLLKVDELGRRYVEAVDKQIKLLRDSTDKELLNMKWSDFLALKIDKFADYQRSVPTSTVATRSRSVNRKPQRIRTMQRTWTRVHSVDREKMDDDPTLSFLRWPRAGEPVLSKAGSPLALPKPLEERCPNVQIPTSKGVITVKPHKLMKQVKREVLMNLDQNTLAQVKTLTANLGEIVNMATKMGKL